MKLYHHPFSSNARKAVMAADVLGIGLELVVVDLAKGESRQPDYLKLNLNGKVPVLVDGDFVLWESHAIMAYLADLKPGNTLYPAEPRARADVNRWLFWSSSHWSPAISTLTQENMLKKMLGKGEPDPAQVQRGEAFVAQFAGVLDQHLAGREWLRGERLTIADLAVAAPLMYTAAAKLPVGGYDNLQRWFGNVQGLDAWKKTTI